MKWTKETNGTHPPHQWREVCCLRHTATGHVEPPVTHQEVLVEQRSVWAQHGLSAALIRAHVKHLQRDTSASKWFCSKGQGTSKTRDGHECCIYCKLYSYSVPFIVSPKTVDLSHRKSASAETSLDNCRAQEHDKRGILYLKNPRAT